MESIVRKVTPQVSHVDLSGAVCLTGGLCECEYIRVSLGKALKREIAAHKNGRYAGAIGAALAAKTIRKEEVRS